MRVTIYKGCPKGIVFAEPSKLNVPVVVPVVPEVRPTFTASSVNALITNVSTFLVSVPPVTFTSFANEANVNVSAPDVPIKLLTAWLSL